MATIDKYKFFEQIGYDPHSEAQHEYHQSTARFRIPCCGRRFGKSTMAGNDLAPKMLVPKSRYWIVGPTYDLGEKEFRVLWDAFIIKLQFGKDKRVKKAYNKRSGEMYIEMPWGARTEVRSADHPENLVGEALDGVIMSEAAKQKPETWERFIRPALADRRGFADFPTTPEGFNWLHDLWQFGQNPDMVDYASWNFPSWANTKVYPGGRDDPEIKLLELTTAYEWFLQEIAAEFAAFVGKIFPEWNEKTHVTKVPFDPKLPSYGAWDWGYTNPLAFIEFQITPRDEVRIWREHYLAFTTLEDHFHLLRNRPQPEGYHLDMTFGDAADPEAIEMVNRKFGTGCMGDPDAKTNWREGIDLIRTFMKPRPSLIEVDEYGTPADDKPGFYVDHSCKNVVHELNNYRSKAPVKGQNVPELGNKVEDHTIDAIRYGLMHLFVLGAQHHLTDIYSESDFTSTSTPDPNSGGGFFQMGGEF